MSWNCNGLLKLRKIKLQKPAFLLKKPDRLRTTPPNLDFLNVENTTLASTVSTEYLQAPNTQSVKLSDWQVVLDDVFFQKPYCKV